MDRTDSPSGLMPLSLPERPLQRIVLVMMRRMTAHGLRDAQAGLLAIQAFGAGFPQPLVLLRAYIAELARASSRRIVVAPCCAPRMTLDEGRLLGVLATAASNPACAEKHLRLLVGEGAKVGAPLSVATAFAGALADRGQPLML